VYDKVHPERLNNYIDNKSGNDKIDHYLNFKGVKYPMAIKDIIKFEKNNDVSINVFSSTDDKSLKVERMSKKVSDNTVSLLFVTDSEGNCHYVYIKNFNKLYPSRHNNHKKN
jgi:hypothetical protein